MGRCILVCAGEYAPVRNPAWRLEKKAGDLVIAVDAGLRYLMDEGIMPDVILGDLDSLAESEAKESTSRSGDKNVRQLVAQYREMGGGALVQLPVEKDDTDTMAAARLGIAKGYREFLIYGGLGGRLDHTMANIQTLVWIRRQGGHGWLVADRNRATVIESETLEIPAAFEGTVSVFSLDRELRGVDIKGLRYEVSDGVISNGFPIGCSNEKRAGRAGTIRVGVGAALVVMIEGLINEH